MSIKEGWQSYNDEVLPADAGKVQRQETQHAFFAGAWHVLMILSDLGDDDIPADDAAEMLADLVEEVQRYYRTIGAQAS